MSLTLRNDPIASVCRRPYHHTNNSGGNGGHASRQLRLYRDRRRFRGLCRRGTAQRIGAVSRAAAGGWRQGSQSAGSTSRWASPSSTPTRASTGCTRANPKRSSAGAGCISRAARCSAAPARSTAWCTCAATRPTMTNGASAAAPAGTGTVCCRTSRRPNTRSAVPTSSMASAVRCMCPISRTDRNSRIGWWKRRSRRACLRSRISTTAARKVPDISRAPPAGSAAGAPRPPICVRHAAATTLWCARTRMPRAS